MITFALCKISTEEHAQCFTKAFVSFADYKSLMTKIETDHKANLLLTNRPYIKIKQCIFELTPDMNLLDGFVAINSYHRKNLNISLGNIIDINFLESNVVQD